MTTVKDDNSQSVDFKLEWNNRRVSIKEHYQLDDRGIPINVSVEGISAFGAPVKESYERSDAMRAGKAVPMKVSRVLKRIVII